MAIQRRRNKSGSVAIGITWCERTWTYIFGCTPKSRGCRYCWASDVSASNSRKGLQVYDGLTILRGDGHYVFKGQVKAKLSVLAEAFSWGRPSRVFVNSQSDTFHEDVKWEWLDEAFKVMALLPQHVFQVLTKRPDVMRKYLEYRQAAGLPVLPHVHLGFSAEDQGSFDKRWEDAKHVAAMGWLVWASLEPQIGPISVAKALKEGLAWVVTGGENTLKHELAAEYHVEWAEQLVKECDEAGVPVFVKQMGTNPFHGGVPQKFTGEGKHYVEWPENIQRQEYPKNRPAPPKKKAA